MEDTLRVRKPDIDKWSFGLNPCFNGRYSQSLRLMRSLTYCNKKRLNPCFNGRYSQRLLRCATLSTLTLVLILVLMEDTLRDNSVNEVKQAKAVVLILVLMEDTLRVSSLNLQQSKRRLNPCFNGRYSQR